MEINWLARKMIVGRLAVLIRADQKGWGKGEIRVCATYFDK